MEHKAIYGITEYDKTGSRKWSHVEYKQKASVDMLLSVSQLRIFTASFETDGFYSRNFFGVLGFSDLAEVRGSSIHSSELWKLIN